MQEQPFLDKQAGTRCSFSLQILVVPEKGDGRKETNVLMEREEFSLRTVSITSVGVLHNKIQMKYLDMIHNKTMIKELDY